MKFLLPLFIALASLPALAEQQMSGMSVPAAAVDHGYSRVSVTHFGANFYTEGKKTAGGANDDAWPRNLGRLLNNSARIRLADGFTFSARILDVDLAGETTDGKRVYSRSTPPLIVLEYTVRDASGMTLEGGKIELTDPTYLDRKLDVRKEPLAYERAIIEQWLNGLLGPVAPPPPYKQGNSPWERAQWWAY